jgi:hypothetical protein
MNTPSPFQLLPLPLLVIAALICPVCAEEMVTVPKSRLQELERKESELQKLTGDLGKAQAEEKRLTGEQQRLKEDMEKLRTAKQAAEAEAAAAATAAAKAGAVIQHDTPPMGSLPPLHAGEVVGAMDLMNHYRADAAAAKKRYEANQIRVEGEVVSFGKPMFVRPYIIYLKTTDRAWKVACTVHPPESFSAVFTVKGGDEIVGSTSRGPRQTIAKIGQKVVIEGTCKGLRGQTITLSGCALHSLP